jgi:hypothetical protein
LSLSLCVATVDAWPLPPRREVYGSEDASTRYGSKHRMPSVVFANGLDGVVHCTLGLLVYVMLRNSRHAARALHDAQAGAGEAGHALARRRLDAVRARIDPGELSRALEDVERAYATDAAAGDARLDELIDFLRAAIPGARAGAAALEGAA